MLLFRRVSSHEVLGYPASSVAARHASCALWHSHRRALLYSSRDSPDVHVIGQSCACVAVLVKPDCPSHRRLDWFPFAAPQGQSDSIPFSLLASWPL
jgi:hypothetical protein